MEKLLFAKSVLQKLEIGGHFRRVITIALKTLAVLLALGMLWLIINMWRALSEASGAMIAGAVLLQLLLVGATYAAVHTMLIRARNITALTDGPYTVIPVVSILLRMLGEVYAAFSVAVAIGFALIIWISGSTRFPIHDLDIFAPTAPFLSGIDNAFFLGLGFMLAGLVMALIRLIIFYFLSEATLVLGDVGLNARARR